MSKQGQTNGSANTNKYIDSIDPDDPEYLRQLQRPAEVKQDVRQMEDRKRVHLILNSKAFRSELERLVDDRMKSGDPCPPSLLALQQQISGLFLPQARLRHGALFGQGGNGPTIPINDFKSDEAIPGYAKGEKLLRCKLASCYRLVDIFGWNSGAPGLISARVSSEDEQYLVAPAGLQHHELTASKLVKVDKSGSVVDVGSQTRLSPTRAAFSLVNLAQAARSDLKAVIYLCNPSVVRVSAETYGLLPLCVDAMALGDVPFCDADAVPAVLGDTGKVVFVKNKGLLVGGESVEEVFHLTRSVMNAVDTQLRTIPLGLDNIILPSEEARRKAFELANQAQHTPSAGGDPGARRWRRGELEFEALMRRLENAGFRTGYPFHDSLVRKVERSDRVNADVEVPPTLTAIAMQGDDGSAEKLRKSTPKVDWVNSSSAYKREELDMPGAPQSKKITKWVPQENTPGAVIRIESANQFAPIGADPKELKAKFHQIRREYYDDNITCGPQSRILEGVTWEEAQKIKEGNVASDTVIVVGAASRAVVQRDFQNAAAVYKTYYAPNPFDNVTEEDVEQYKAEVEHKTRRPGEPMTTDDEVLTPGEEGHLISTEERMQQVREQTLSASPPPESTDVNMTRELSPPPTEVSSTRPVDPVRVDTLPAAATTTTPAVIAAETSPKSPAKPERGRTTDAQTDVDVGSPVRSTGGTTSPQPTTAEATPEKKKKKRGFRMPSFSSKKKEK